MICNDGTDVATVVQGGGSGAAQVVVAGRLHRVEYLSVDTPCSVEVITVIMQSML